MPLWRFTVDVESDDEAMTQDLADRMAKGIGSFAQSTEAMAAGIKIVRAEPVYVTAHVHTSTRRESCMYCYNELANDERN